MFNSKTPPIEMKHIFDAFEAHIQRHSVIVVQVDSSKEQFIGSGTCIEVNNRLFVSTAAHNFSVLKGQGAAKLFPAQKSPHRALRFISHGFSKFGDKDTLDIAWIEIYPESARQCNLDALPVSAIEPNPTLAFDNSMMYIVAGFPAENVSISKKGGDSYLHCVLSLFITIPGKQDQSDGGLFFEYPEDPISFGDLPLPDPAGLSGGTVWAAPMASDSPIFVPDFMIVGVITHFWPKTRLIRCERFGNWLELLLTDNAELGEHIKPILRTIQAGS